jgi:hypothetical protein
VPLNPSVTRLDRCPSVYNGTVLEAPTIPLPRSRVTVTSTSELASDVLPRVLRTLEM